MSQTSSGFDPVDDLVEAFLERYRRGERPSLSEYTDKHPELAERIRSLFPALLVIEEIGSGGKLSPTFREDFAGPEPMMPRRLGEYLLIRRVGSGGMGIVYEAIHESLGRHVALKTLPHPHLGDPTRLERFRREARAAAGLHHTHIVPVYGIGEHDGLHFYTMQFIRGQGLDSVLQEVKRLRRDSSPFEAPEAPDGQVSTISLACGLRTGRYPANKAQSEETGSAAAGCTRTDPGRAPEPAARTSLLAESNDRSGLFDQPEARYILSVARIGADVAEALEYAHQQGILHRDIKPANLLLDAQGQIWITDFGLAKVQDSDELTRTGDVVGTLKYMAPERFNGWSDPRSDIYALGVTLYELLTLRPAFEESDRIKLVEQVLHQSPPPLRQLDRRIPRDLETIVLKAMAKEPGERYPSAEKLAEDLRRFAAGRPILARRSSTAERVWRWSRRNPLLAGAAGTVAAALVGMTVTAVLYADRQYHFATEQEKANREIIRLNLDLGKERVSLRKSLSESNRLLAIRNFDRGQSSFEKDQIGSGLLWMIESWRSAIEAGDPAWQHAARANLAAWQPHHARLKVVLSHESPVDAAAFSPDGKTVLTGGDDRTARLWDTATGKPIGSPLNHPGVWTVAYGPDGKTVLTGGGDGTAQWWNSATGRPLGKPIRHRLKVRSVAFSPDGRTVLTGSEDKTARLWDAVTNQPIGPFLVHQGPVVAVAFSPDGKSFLTASSDNSVRLWDADPGQPFGLIRDQQGVGQTLAFSPDGKSFFGAHWGGTVKRWDTASGRSIGPTMSHQGPLLTVAVSHDGTRLLTGSKDKTARLWNTATARPIGPALQHEGEVLVVAFSSDGKTIMTGGEDRTVRFWDAASGTALGRPLSQADSVDAAAFSPDGRSLLTGYSGGWAELWDLATRMPHGQPFPHPGCISAAAFSPDGKSLLTGCEDGAARLWDVETRTLRVAPLLHQAWIWAVAFSPDGTIVLTGSRDKTARLWDAGTGMPLGPPIPHPTQVWSVAFSPDGKSFVTGDFDNVARLFRNIPELPDDLERVATWVEVLTGLALDAGQGTIHVLDNAAWRERRDHLERRGGPPEVGGGPRLDPIPFGIDPMARGRALMQREQWDDAEAAFDEVVRARPYNASSWMARSGFHISRRQLGRAAVDFAGAIQALSEDSQFRYSQILLLLDQGDRAGLRQACSDLLDRYGTVTDPYSANSVAWTCALVPDAVADRDAPVRLAEAALAAFPPAQKSIVMNTLGAALYRAGRFEESIHLLEEGVRKRGGESLPQDWSFLALAYHRLGRRPEALRWLNRFHSYQPKTDANAFWNELEIRILRTEAESFILYDPVFPPDPFAR